MFTAQVYSSSLLLKCLRAGHLQVYDQSHLQVYCQTRVTFKFTVRVTCKFTTSVTFKFSAHQVYYQCYLQVYCQSHLHVYLPNLKLSLMTDQVLADICVQWEPIQNCSSLLLKFTCKFYPLPLPIKHRYMEYHYTEEVSHIAECTYTHGGLTLPSPPIKHRCMQNHYTQ